MATQTVSNNPRLYQVLSDVSEATGQPLNSLDTAASSVQEGKRYDRWVRTYKSTDDTELKATIAGALDTEFSKSFAKHATSKDVAEAVLPYSVAVASALTPSGSSSTIDHDYARIFHNRLDASANSKEADGELAGVFSAQRTACSHIGQPSFGSQFEKYKGLVSNMIGADTSVYGGKKHPLGPWEDQSIAQLLFDDMLDRGFIKDTEDGKILTRKTCDPNSVYTDLLSGKAAPKYSFAGGPVLWQRYAGPTNGEPAHPAYRLYTSQLIGDRPGGAEDAATAAS